MLNKYRGIGVLCAVMIVAVVLWRFSLPAGVFAGEDNQETHADTQYQEETALHDEHEPEEGSADDHDEDSHDDHEEAGIVEISPEAMKLAGVTLAKVNRGRIDKSVDLHGEVGFDEDHLVHVAPRFPGIAKEARYRVGDYVHAGDELAVIESNESLSSYSIKATISGWIIMRHISPGEYVSEEKSIFIIADLSNVWVNLAVYPKDAERIKPGLKAQIRAIGSETQTEGIIEYVTPILDVNTRSITARVVLPNPDHTWRPGTFVNARVITDPGDEGFVVEKTAVQVLDNEHVVFVPEGVGRFKPVPVETGDSDSRYTRIHSGLEWGMEYVAAGAFELKAKIVTSALGGHAGHGH